MSLLNRRRTTGVLLACTFVVAAWSAASSTYAADKKVKLSGCLIRGEGDNPGYLLANPPTEPWLGSSSTQVTPTVLGTSGDYATIFYWTAICVNTLAIASKSKVISRKT